SNYKKFADNALLVLQINMSNGTKKPLLHNDIKSDGSQHIMTYVNANDTIKPKEIKLVLKEHNF
ncbi:4541_t:CDS:1, partial [Cetraspora pellucida]